MTSSSNSTEFARLRIVNEHVDLENEHDLNGIMATFGTTARYDDEPWGAHYVGRQEVRDFYARLLRALPDMHIDVRGRHVAEHAVILEVIIRGRHLASWRGLPATGHQIEFPLCGVYTFDEENRLAGERIRLRPRYRAPAAGSVSRAGELPWAHHHRTDASRHNGSDRRAEIFATRQHGQELTARAPFKTISPSVRSLDHRVGAGE